jgi:hypothetical protein
MRCISWPAAALVSLALSGSATADELTMPPAPETSAPTERQDTEATQSSEQATTAEVPPQTPAPETSADRPTRGMSMEKVEAKYGAPAKRVPAVGEPPISSWEYPGFIVYFEHNLVIHAVVTS